MVFPARQGFNQISLFLRVSLLNLSMVRLYPDELELNFLVGLIRDGPRIAAQWPQKFPVTRLEYSAPFLTLPMDLVNNFLPVHIFQRYELKS